MEITSVNQAKILLMESVLVPSGDDENKERIALAKQYIKKEFDSLYDILIESFYVEARDILKNGKSNLGDGLHDR